MPTESVAARVPTRGGEARPAARPAAVRRPRPTGTAIRALVAWVLALATFFPIGWLVLSVFKPADESFTPSLPRHWTLGNLRYVLTEVPFPRWALNSAIIALTVTVVALVFHTMAAYALARLRFRGRDAIFSMMVSTLLVSLPVILVPLFLIAKELGLLDSYAGLIVPMIFNAFGIFLLRQYYLNFPPELEEAAQLDGCGYLRVYWHVILPLSRPAMASLSVLFFLANWNAFLWPLTITRNPDLTVTQTGMAAMQGQYTANFNYVLAGSVVAAVPTVIVFLIGQRWLVESMKNSGLK